MSLRLTLAREELGSLFRALGRPSDVAHLLDVKYDDLVYWAYRVPKQSRYTAFEIKKKSGAHRQIEAPGTNIKILQQKLNQVLQAVYRPKPCVHGFVEGRSVRTNALQHTQRRYVLNVDLRDFFPSINFGRVRGMFMARPYNVPEKVATVLAHLCCFEGRLPQGAPTSPTVSNMICARMDSELQRLARTNGCIYTRYADDMTFSTFRPEFPRAVAGMNDLHQAEPGDELLRIVETNGFTIHPEKVWLRRQDRRQEVTGVTVNAFPNLPRRFTNRIRAMLHAWETHGLDAAQAEFEQRYDRKHRPPGSRVPSFQKVVKGRIEYLGMITRGESPKYLRFLDQLWRLAPDLADGRGTPLDLLLRRYDALAACDDPHARGYLLQDLLRDAMEVFGIPVENSFTRNDNGEQIDGAFKLGAWFYIAECRWRERIAGVRQVDGLAGQVARSGAQTMGVFFSVKGWSRNVPRLLKQNPEKRIILMDGADFRSVLAGRIAMEDLLQEKLEELNFKSEPYLSIEDILSRRSG